MTESIEAPKIRKPSSRELSSAESDLEWWFCCRHAALGIGAAAIEPRTRATDLGADWQAIAKLTNHRHRAAVDRANRIAARLSRLGGEFMSRADALYSPPSSVYVDPKSTEVARGREDDIRSAKLSWGVPLLAREYFALRHGGHVEGDEWGGARRSGPGEVTLVGLAILILERSPDREVGGRERIAREFCKPEQARPRWCRELRDRALDARTSLLTAYVETWP